MSEFELSNDKICFGDLQIFLAHGDNEEKYAASDDCLFMFKHAGYVRTYEQIKGHFNRPVQDILEIGMFRGGGAVFLHRLFDAQRLVCVDLLPGPVVPLERYRQQNPGVSSYYGVDQSDRAAMADIMQREFPHGVDLVVDDASHFYEETQASFEVVFPYLRYGGIYVIEDWNWAHCCEAQSPDYHLADRSALTNLIFDLVMLHGAGDILDLVVCGPGMMWSRRGTQPLGPGEFRLEDHTPKRGRELGRI